MAPLFDQGVITMPRHPLYEDLLALIVASSLVSLGVFLFKEVGLLTGGTAGLTLLLTHLTDFSFGQWFFVLNLPFYYLAWQQMGRRFTLNTFLSVSVVSICVDNLHWLIQLQQIDAIYAALAGGMLIGVGMLVMFRHHSSLGGFGILALYLQKSRGVRAGLVQMVLDCLIVVASFFIVPWWVIALSVLAAIMCNLVLTLNHKPGRYQIA